MNEWIIAVGIFTVLASAGLEYITQQAVSKLIPFYQPDYLIFNLKLHA